MDTLDLIVSKINSKLGGTKLFYFTNDPERSLGLEKIVSNYVIVHIDDNEYLDDFEKHNIKYFCLSKSINLGADFFRSSLKLIKSQEFTNYFNQEKAHTNYMQTFKISPAFELAVRNLGGKPVNTSAKLNRLYEDKISQFQIISKLPICLPKTKVSKLDELNYHVLSTDFGGEFVLQFARGHTGSGTVFIKNESEFNNIKDTFQRRTVKVSEYISGTPYTVNCCITRQGVVFGGLSKQITGIKKLTPLIGSTVGNDWSNQADFINGINVLENEISIIGEKMREDGYLGMFGLDIIVKEDGGFVFIEINARQPASIPMFTKMQLMQGQIPLALLHLAEFLEIDYKIDIEQYNQDNMRPFNFSQIFVRAQKDCEIKTELQSGIYRLQGDNAGFDPVIKQQVANVIFLDEQRDKALILQKSAYSIDALQDCAGMLLLTQVPGRIIKQNDEFARMQLNTSAFQKNGVLKPWIVEVLQTIYLEQT